jgi:hypothetical protein
MLNGCLKIVLIALGTIVCLILLFKLLAVLVVSGYIYTILESM